MNKKDLLIVSIIICVAIAGIFVNEMMQKTDDSSYVTIYVGSDEYRTVSLNEPQTIAIDRDGKHNEITITNEGVFMSNSDCDNQDCIEQGKVTLDNIGTRIMGGWIVCLPNEVSIELVKGESI